MCKHKHALKGKMIRDVQKRRSSPDPRLQLFLSAGKQSPLFISHMARPPLLLTRDGEMLRKPCEDMSRGPVWERLSWSTKSPSGSELKCWDFLVLQGFFQGAEIEVLQVLSPHIQLNSKLKTELQTHKIGQKVKQVQARKLRSCWPNPRSFYQSVFSCWCVRAGRA